jgi:hypothetical protein
MTNWIKWYKDKISRLCPHTHQWLIDIYTKEMKKEEEKLRKWKIYGR